MKNRRNKEKETKNKNCYSSEEMVHVIVHGVSADGGRDYTVGRICDGVAFASCNTL